jgi:hypothetical protein
VSIVASVAAVVVLTGMTTSPYAPRLLPGDGPADPLAGIARAFGLDALSHTTAALLGIAVMALGIAAFVYALAVAWRGDLSVRAVLGLSIAFQVVMAALPVLLSQDVYSYAIYGRIATVYHANPYVHTPMHYSHDPVFSYVGSGWRTTPAVYGPVFTLLSAILARFVHSPLGLVLSFKVISGAAGIATLLLVARIARRIAPGRAAFAVALLGWNPVMVAYATGGGHNDTLVALCVAGAFALLLRSRDAATAAGENGEWKGRPWWELGAVGVLTMGALIKVGVAPALVLTMVATVASRPPGRRLRLLGAEVAVAAGLTVAFAAPYWQTHDPTLGVSSLVGHREWIAPMRFLLSSLGGLAQVVGGHAVRTVVEVLIRVSMAAVSVWALAVVAMALARRRNPFAEGAGWGWVLLVLLLASPVVLPWYLGWALPVAWLLPRVGRRITIAVSGILALTHAIARPALVPSLFGKWLILGHHVVGPVLLLALIWLVVAIERQRRTGAPLEDPDLVPAVPVPVEPVPAASATG